ncbi:hypothetical protein HU200_066829 [Digitaria exilis]|uniref:Uncharacterized protein n=1 Tax=Digitaria exilis TaxID=1010633 RepID=A0A835A177_9POAL|nr:hypothetical protein HU200_066829 [Digitaria exilis]CAB3453149.1 unnamed protein product [Digitaria exilis]
MMLGKSSMDLVLVPCALALMVSYHLLLLYRILRRPNTTVIGYENHSKLAWVQRMAQTTEPAEAALALSVISDGISASTTLASLCIALASLIGAWVSSRESATVSSDAPASTCSARCSGAAASGPRAPGALPRHSAVRVGRVGTGGYARLLRAHRRPALPSRQQLRAATPPPVHSENGKQGSVPDDGETGRRRHSQVDELRSLSSSQSSSFFCSRKCVKSNEIA